jgi:hypothetical protein
VASADAAKREPKPFANPVFFHGFFGILRTGWKKTAAVADERADRRLVETQEKYYYFLHRIIIS